MPGKHHQHDDDSNNNDNSDKDDEDDDDEDGGQHHQHHQHHHNPNDPEAQKWFHGSIPLGLEDDKYWLSELQVYLRSNFAEAFGATEEDIAGTLIICFSVVVATCYYWRGW